MIKWKKKSIMNNKKYLSMLGLARRAGKLSMGHDMALKAVKEKKAKIVVFASDVSPRLIEEFKRACDYDGINILNIEERINDIHSALGYKAGVITVNDENFSRRIEELIKEEFAHGD
ncbi:MAG: ribosomal L7Ae/L30e/S12e/Gadd45 family protein [Eubacterium sp.]|nr:ribosomal L7Ae/L30e/S12e/Gadd45 family protein [Eubacterium sp.]